MTPEQEETLEALWGSELTIIELARTVGCRTSAIRDAARKLKLGPRHAAADAARARWRQSWEANSLTRPDRDVTPPGPKPLMPESKIAALYAGRRYEDHPRPTVSFGRPPMRDVINASAVGCAAAMTAGA